MDKIKNLLTKAGCKPELVDSIVESMGNYKETIREQLEAEYAAKVEEAKKVCIEETEAHKRELSRRLAIFCETKSAAIEAQLAKKSALNESEAESRLQNIKDLLEGIEPSGPQNGAITAALKKAKRQIQVANEEKKRAIEAANRKVAIAEKVMKQNRALTTENTHLKSKLKGGQTVSEGRRKGQHARRIDGGRQQSQKPVSTRATLLENQDRRPPRQHQQSHVTGTGNGGPMGVNDIASVMEEDLI